MDYTVLGSPVNLAARLQNEADPGKILIDQSTQSLIELVIETDLIGEIKPRGFARSVTYHEVLRFRSESDRSARRQLTHVGEHVEVSVTDSSNIRAAIEELREIQKRFESQLEKLGA